MKFNETNKIYINDLIFIEKWILGKSYGLITHYLTESLKESYKEEYMRIYKELKPRDFKKIRKRAIIREQKTKKSDEKGQLQEEKKEWLKFGGIL